MIMKNLVEYKSTLMNQQKKLKSTKNHWLMFFQKNV